MFRLDSIYLSTLRLASVTTSRSGAQVTMARMKIDPHGMPQRGTMSARLGRAALLVICVVVFAVLGIAVPYKTYNYFKAKQDAVTTSESDEEL